MVLEIALGIVLAIIILRFLGTILALAGVLLLLAVVLGALFLFFDDLSTVLLIGLLLIFMRFIFSVADTDRTHGAARSATTPEVSTSLQKSEGNAVEHSVGQSNARELERIHRIEAKTS
jgi:hypothetical protein